MAKNLSTPPYLLLSVYLPSLLYDRYVATRIYGPRRGRHLPLRRSL